MLICGSICRWVKPCLARLFEEDGSPLLVGSGLVSDHINPHTMAYAVRLHQLSSGSSGELVLQEHLESFDGPGGFWELFVQTPVVFKQEGPEQNPEAHWKEVMSHFQDNVASGGSPWQRCHFRGNSFDCAQKLTLLPRQSTDSMADG